MELRQLKYFLAVADARSFVSASNALYLSRQAVSKAISQLESELGVELFMRDSNGAFLTPAGVMFYDQIRSSVRKLDRVREEMQQYGARYYQHIRLSFSIGTMRLYENALISFKAAQTNVDIQYAEYPEETCKKQLLEHQSDLAICTERPPDSQFSTEEIIRSPYGILCRALEDLPEVLEISEIKFLPLAGFADTQTVSLCSSHGVALTYTGFDLYRLFELTAAGKCVMLLPEALFPAEWRAFRWIKLQNLAPWVLFRVLAQSTESNILYRTVLDDLQMQVFDTGSIKNKYIAGGDETP